MLSLLLCLHKNIFYELILNIYLMPQIRPFGVQAFQAVHENKHFLVNLKQKSCQCGVWQYDGIPWLHACAAIRRLNLNQYDFVKKCYFNNELRASYNAEVFPVGTKDQWVKTCDLDESSIKPLIHKRALVRLKTERFRSVGEFKHQCRCSHCGKVGHNKGSCNNLVLAELTEMPSSKKKTRIG